MNDTLTATVQRYVAERRKRGEIGALTARNLTAVLRTFSVSFGRRPLSQLGSAAVDRWLAELGHLAPSTRVQALSTLRGFARWLVRQGLAESDFTANTPRIRRPRQASRDMTALDAARILEQCQTPRERLIVWLMFAAGLRCVEVSRLNAEDITDGWMTITGKGGHVRILPIADPLAAALRAYLAAYPVANGPLVQREDHRYGRVTADRVSSIVRRLALASGVKERRYDGRCAHGLRATAASDLLDACGDLRVVKEFLGHANLATTSVYLRRSERTAIRHAVDQRWAETA